eukprot:403353748
MQSYQKSWNSQSSTDSTNSNSQLWNQSNPFSSQMSFHSSSNASQNTQPLQTASTQNIFQKSQVVQNSATQPKIFDYLNKSNLPLISNDQFVHKREDLHVKLRKEKKVEKLKKIRAIRIQDLKNTQSIQGSSNHQSHSLSNNPFQTSKDTVCSQPCEDRNDDLINQNQNSNYYKHQETLLSVVDGQVQSNTSDVLSDQQIHNLQLQLAMLENDTRLNDELYLKIVDKIYDTLSQVPELATNQPILDVLQQKHVVYAKIMKSVMDKNRSNNLKKRVAEFLINLCCLSVEAASFINSQQTLISLFDQVFKYLCVSIGEILNCLDGYAQLLNESATTPNNVTAESSQEVAQYMEKCYSKAKLQKKQLMSVARNMLWALGNFASDCIVIQETVIMRSGIFTWIQQLLSYQSQNDLSLILQLEQSLLYISSGFQQEWTAHYESIFQGLQAFRLDQILQSDKSGFNLLKFLNDFTSENEKGVHLLMKYVQNILGSLVDNLSQTNSYELFIMSIKLIGNIVFSSNSNQCEELIKFNFLRILVDAWHFYQSPQTDAEVCWVLSNLTCNKSQIIIQSLLSEEELMFKIIESILNSKMIKVRREAVHCLMNLSIISTKEQMFQLIYQYDIVKNLFDLLCQLSSNNSYLLPNNKSMSIETIPSDLLMTILQTLQNFMIFLHMQLIENQLDYDLVNSIGYMSQQPELKNILRLLCEHKNQDIRYVALEIQKYVDQYKSTQVNECDAKASEDVFKEFQLFKNVNILYQKQ